MEDTGEVRALPLELRQPLTDLILSLSRGHRSRACWPTSMLISGLEDPEVESTTVLQHLVGLEEDLDLLLSPFR